MVSQDLSLPVLTQKGEFKTKCNPVKVGQDMPVGSDLNYSESITVEDMLYISHLKLDLENWKAEFCLETEHRDGFLDEPRWIFISLWIKVLKLY